MGRLNALLGLFGVENATHADVLSSEELKGLVATSHTHGNIEADQAGMLKNMFEFDQRQVGRVMIPKVSLHCLDVSATPDENLEVIRETEHSRFPVIDSENDENIVEIVLIKDIHRALLSGEIEDETDQDDELQAIETIDDRHWESDGLVSLSDAQKQLGLAVPADLDANTLSGLFMERLARMPIVGDEIIEGDFTLRVLGVTDYRVGRVSIERAPLEGYLEDQTTEDENSTDGPQDDHDVDKSPQKPPGS